MTRNDHTATVQYLKWSATLGSWVLCGPADRGATKFVRDEAEPVKLRERYWTIALEGKIIGDPLGQYGMQTVCVSATSAEEAGRIALEQEKDSATELKIMFVRPS